MKLMRSYPLALSLAISTSVYGLYLNFNKTAVAQSQSATSIAEIIQAEGGKVQLKRENARDYTPTQTGEKLYLGDLLRVAKGATVVIQCKTDKTTWPVPDDGLPWGVANTCSPPS
jgi:hypothetical protein